MFRARELLLSVSGGGTGRNTLATNGIMLGEGASPVNVLANGTAGRVLISTAGDPTWLPVNTQNPAAKNPAGTTSTTGVLMGLGTTLTPQASGVVFITICGDITNGTKADGAEASLYYGTGSTPLNGAALTGTHVTGSACRLVNSGSTSGNFRTPFSLTAIVSGLTLGTSYWFDLSLAAVTGGTATIADVIVCLMEIR